MKGIRPAFGSSSPVVQGIPAASHSLKAKIADAVIPRNPTCQFGGVRAGRAFFVALLILPFLGEWLKEIGSGTAFSTTVKVVLHLSTNVGTPWVSPFRSVNPPRWAVHGVACTLRSVGGVYVQRSHFAQRILDHPAETHHSENFKKQIKDVTTELIDIVSMEAFPKNNKSGS